MPNSIWSAWPTWSAGIVTAALCAPAAYAQQHDLAGEMLGAPPEGKTLLAGQMRHLQPSLAMQVVPRAAVAAADDPGPDFPLTIKFDPGSARLKPSATRALDRLGQALSNGALAGERVRLEGHADVSGSPESNRDVSGRRARAVASYLKQNFDIDPARLDCQARGSVPPARRVVLINRLGNG